ncbi:MAG: OmpA family protein, partial [Pseudomonadota bacterium]
LSVGAGALYRLGNFPGTLRTEVRVRNDLIDGGNFTDLVFSAGFLFPFGPGVDTTPPDSDGDGVLDDVDQCPNSPIGAIVDSTGCELDSDGDGVPDRLDRCPGTTRGAEVDEAGCALDDDNDGVPNYRDRCPNTPPGTPVGDDGCTLDDDGDGVLNADDECPNTRAGARVDFRGCEIRDEISLPGVNFETNSNVLLPTSIRTLDGAVETLRRYDDLIVECDGHTDSRGAASYNESLSQRRAEAVCDYLSSRGISSSRLSARGYGESQPIASNDTAEGRAANRRVTLKVLQ